MAESIVSDLVGRLLGYLAQSAAGNITSYFGGKEKLNQLGQTMTMIQARLHDAERRQEAEDRKLVKEWLKGLKQVLYRLEDLFEEVSVADRQQTESVCICIPRLKLNKMVNTDFKAIVNELKALTSDMDGLRLRGDSVENPRAFYMINGRETDSSVLEEKVIGRDGDKNEIVRMLLDQDLAAEAVSVIPIVGMGGLGKTTLAQLAYNDTDVQQHFELKAWACIAEISSFEELAGKVLKSISTGGDCQNYSIEQIRSGLEKAVKDKRYLLVLDDVWDEDRERWHRLRRFLHGGKQGSKIIVTSRSEVVATNMGGTVEPYELKGLTEDQSWVLFKSLAFRQGQEEGNPNLSSIGREIVKKCVNVPLAIRTIAGILYSRDTEEEWMHFKDREIRTLEQKENNIMSTLKLSYDHLPHQLKQCFAYCKLFPKDYVFNKQRLIRLWMSQGFVEPSDHLGEIYFMELLRRCFFQDVVRDCYGRIERCKMHDLMHDLACMVGDECLSVDGSREYVFNNNIRHVSFESVSVAGLTWKAPSWLFALQQVRSLLLPDMGSGYEEYSIVIMDKIFSEMRCLRVLDFGDTVYKRLPNSIGELKHLRYLKISVSSCLPNGITRLQYLQTLDIDFQGGLRELPKGFNKLISLRPFRFQIKRVTERRRNGINLYDEPLFDMPPRFGELTSLQELSEFVVGENNGLDALACMNLVGELRVYYRKCRPNAISETMAGNLKDKKLTDLLLSWRWLDDEEAATEADEELKCLQPPQTLIELTVKEWRGEHFPSWGMDEFPCSLPNLVSITISGCSRCHHLPKFGRLPHLKCLQLWGLPALEYIEGEGSSTPEAPALAYFPSLQTLSLRLLPELKGWLRIQCTSSDFHPIPQLIDLDIRECPKLKSMPLSPRLVSLVAQEVQGMLRHLSHLKELELYGCDELDLWSVMDNDGDDNDDGEMDTIVISFACQDLKNLQVLKLGNISKLESLPKGLSCLTTLQELCINWLPNLKSLPQWIGQLTQLCQLHIGNCSKLSALPESIGGLTTLTRLRIIGCSELKRSYEKPNGEGWPLLQHITHLFC